jgi:hypothetical protein
VCFYGREGTTCLAAHGTFICRRNTRKNRYRKKRGSKGTRMRGKEKEGKEVEGRNFVNDKE